MDLRQFQTCSDDEDYAVLGGASASEADTDELMMGNVDWTLDAGSDDEGTYIQRWVLRLGLRHKGVRLEEAWHAHSG